MPNIPSAQRHTVGMRVLKKSRAYLDEAKELLQATRGGKWSRAHALHHIVSEWLAHQRGEAPR